MARDQRRLAAIVSADVAGYARLMGLGESGTLAAPKAHRRELIDPKIIEHGGHIVKTTGDGLLLEFPSVVEAVRCASTCSGARSTALRVYHSSGALSVEWIIRPIETNQRQRNLRITQGRYSREVGSPN